MQQINGKNFQPNKQRMNIIADILGIEINKPFQIQFFNHKLVYKNTWYKLLENGLVYDYKMDGNYYNKSLALEGLLTGKHQIII